MRKSILIYLPILIFLVMGCKSPTETEPEDTDRNTEGFPLPAPVNFNAVYNYSDGSVELQWRDLTDNELAFALERKVYGSSGFELLSKVGRDINSYTDPGVDSIGAPITYRIKTIGFTTESDYTVSDRVRVIYLTDAGNTIECPYAELGESEAISGVEYTKRSADQITPENASTTCTTGITQMTDLFRDDASFNGDISGWDVSAVTDMSYMFYNASSFDQDLSSWCVQNIATEPEEFASFSPLTEAHKPVWGTCPAN